MAIITALLAAVKKPKLQMADTAPSRKSPSPTDPAIAVDAKLAATAMAHMDQTNEGDMHFLARLAPKYDAVATVKK